jgi:beta-glucanase (GH16 family)
VRVEEGEGGSGSTRSGRSRRLCLRRQQARASEAGQRTGQSGGTRVTRGDGALATGAQARVREAVARNRGGWRSTWTLTGGPWHQFPSFKPVETG